MHHHCSADLYLSGSGGSVQHSVKLSTCFSQFNRQIMLSCMCTHKSTPSSSLNKGVVNNTVHGTLDTVLMSLAYISVWNLVQTNCQLTHLEKSSLDCCGLLWLTLQIIISESLRKYCFAFASLQPTRTTHTVCVYTGCFWTSAYYHFLLPISRSKALNHKLF